MATERFAAGPTVPANVRAPQEQITCLYLVSKVCIVGKSSDGLIFNLNASGTKPKDFFRRSETIRRIFTSCFAAHFIQRQKTSAIGTLYWPSLHHILFNLASGTFTAISLPNSVKSTVARSPLLVRSTRPMNSANGPVSSSCTTVPAGSGGRWV